ncbi:MAG: TetR/AcrR family transcriptional regulator [Acidobacteria bacterium]|nr:TetR/AcrR family transcriptional regulator [Acidobacteriota bacterium]
MNDPSTKDRILDAAELLLAEQGLNATSLRDITSAAGVNLAAVNYHFRTKDELILAVFIRRVEPMNQLRLTLLDALAPDAPLEDVLGCFFRPVVHMAKHKALVARMYVERRDLFQQIFETHLRPNAQRFAQAFSQRLPGLCRVELGWRLHFLVGLMIHTLAAEPVLRALSGDPEPLKDLDAVVARLVAFGAGGLRAGAAMVEDFHA